MCLALSRHAGSCLLCVAATPSSRSHPDCATSQSLHKQLAAKFHAAREKRSSVAPDGRPLSAANELAPAANAFACGVNAVNLMHRRANGDTERRVRDVTREDEPHLLAQMGARAKSSRQAARVRVAPQVDIKSHVASSRSVCVCVCVRAVQ